MERAQSFGFMNKPKDNYNLFTLYYNVDQFGEATDILYKGMKLYEEEKAQGVPEADRHGIESTPDNWEHLASAYQQNNQPEKAVSALKEAEGYFPDDGALDVQLGEIYYYETPDNADAYQAFISAASKPHLAKPYTAWVFAAYTAYGLEHYKDALDAVNHAETYPEASTNAQLGRLKKGVEDGLKHPAGHRGLRSEKLTFPYPPFMKSKKTSVVYYFLFPLIGLVIYTPIYWKYSASYDARLAERAAEVKAANQRQLDEQNAMRQKAVDEAVAAQAERKRERDAKAAADQKRQDEREAANIALQKAQQEVSRLTDRAEQLTTEVKETKDEIAKIEQDEQAERQQQGFLNQYVAAAQNNVRHLTDVLQKIADADARAAQAAAAKIRVLLTETLTQSLLPSHEKVAVCDQRGRDARGLAGDLLPGEESYRGAPRRPAGRHRASKRGGRRPTPGHRAEGP